jgi:hypothetical protein
MGEQRFVEGYIYGHVEKNQRATDDPLAGLTFKQRVKLYVYLVRRFRGGAPTSTTIRHDLETAYKRFERMSPADRDAIIAFVVLGGNA